MPQIKYCPKAQAILATLKRQRTGKWGETGRGSAAASLNQHLASCTRCGRDLEGEEWPPK